MKTKTKRFLKLTIGAELRKQIVTSIKLRRGPCDDNRDFKPVARKAHKIKRIKLGIGDKAYDDEKNHEFLREELGAMSIIPARYENVPVDEREIQKGDEARVLQEEVSQKVHRRDHLLRRQEDDG